uniref:Ribosomal protein L10e/L16 domain-containing protein n=1 Tax=Chromera velia CCMP2878 TaxID=1169474 RepID=A0A0G4IBZ5_9ALVE|eukprot:Cvel_12987.t1-p1 / transcript=Cvel_12987.t1 / gene=Cvel_12987 / organism=Chromera_velia_CCMP2878 / gene_product=50S ribosomal protein L10, putative / transcript_product=50S ribosomal protein L10, putative / location=Cvel_scaffold870:52765-53625(-) / protein_length=287 / sequence_SO=supercontig / SO=protein_coding / is_pseudo=false
MWSPFHVLLGVLAVAALSSAQVFDELDRFSRPLLLSSRGFLTPFPQAERQLWRDRRSLFRPSSDLPPSWDVPLSSDGLSVLYKRGRPGLLRRRATRWRRSKVGREDTIGKLDTLMANSSFVIVFKGGAVGPNIICKLKKDFLPETAKVMLIKNTVFRVAAKGTKFECLDDLEQQNYYMFVLDLEDKKKVMDSWNKFCKEHEDFARKNPILGGAFDGSKLKSLDEVKAVVQLPGRLELIGKVAGSIKAVPTKVARSVNAVPTKLARAIKMAVADEEKRQNEPGLFKNP